MGGIIIDPALRSVLAVYILDPPYCFYIADLSEIPLGGGEIGMPQDDLADDLYQNAGAGSIRGRMAPQIMRPQVHTDQSAGSSDHDSGSGIGNGKNSLVAFHPLGSDVVFQPVGQLFRDKDSF